MASEIRTVSELAEAFDAKAANYQAHAEHARAAWGAGFAVPEAVASAFAEAARMARALAKEVGDG